MKVLHWDFDKNPLNFNRFFWCVYILFFRCILETVETNIYIRKLWTWVSCAISLRHSQHNECERISSFNKSIKCHASQQKHNNRVLPFLNVFFIYFIFSNSILEILLKVARFQWYYSNSVLPFFTIRKISFLLKEEEKNDESRWDVYFHFKCKLY